MDDHDHEANGDQGDTAGQAVYTCGLCYRSSATNARWLGWLEMEAKDGLGKNDGNAWWHGGRCDGRLRAHDE